MSERSGRRGAAADEGRVRANTAREVNDRIDRDAEDRVRYYAARGPGEIDERIAELEREWSIERAIETEAPVMLLAGLALGVAVDRRFLAVPVVVATAVLVHATEGWYPLLPVFRRLGFRTRTEIDQEKYALKALRGDFDGLGAGEPDPARRALRALAAVDA